MAVAKYVAFAAFIVFAATGIAVGYTGASLLTAYVSYLSPWMPPWLWMVVGALIIQGVAITATSVVGAIAAVAPNPRAYKLCLSLLMVMVVSELAATVLVYEKHRSLGQDLSDFMEQAMDVTQADYGGDVSDTQLWDEIQIELNCCGVRSYNDWLSTMFGKGTDVPDSCCLMVEPGCGKNIVNASDPDDDIITQGCLPTITQALAQDYHSLSHGVWLPVCVMHIALISLLAATAMFFLESYTFVNRRVFSVSASLHSAKPPKYEPLNDKI